MGKTTEAELLARSEFQKSDEKCFGAVCLYRTEQDNSLLEMLHLAPHMFFGSAVAVKGGVVNDVVVIVSRKDLPQIKLMQTLKLPSGCDSSPCVKHMVPQSTIQIAFDGGSDLRNHISEAVNTGCYSRVQGCTYDELMPIAKKLNLNFGAR